MKAAVYRAFGAASDVLTIEDMSRPDPGPGEVLVRVAFSGVNPSDVKARGGRRPGVTKPAFPAIIPHSDGAGVIEAVGEGVDTARLGERVWIWNGQWQRPFGTCAEYIALPAEQAVRLPDAVSLETGAVLGIPGLTAAQVVFGAGSVAGKTLLISGGGGTVGYLAVQLAHWAGARVIATGSPRDFDRIKAAGANVVLDYRAEDLAAQIIAANDGALVDMGVEVEFGLNIGLMADVMRPNGRVAVYGSGLDMTPTIAFGPILFKALTLDVVLIYIQEDADREMCIDKLHAALAEGGLSIPIAEVYGVSDTAQAHDAVARGGREGAVLVGM
ncbi:NADPH:quinone reductase [uncultured Shimia sp.]|uniref:NADPH:quinone reductase n=1 Tax=uncultured Shimia sp. TaxID=573152 RepID=UPI00260F6F43|nr:NADPH:quinone reductase [uncultured Shimia sp.]